MEPSTSRMVQFLSGFPPCLPPPHPSAAWCSSVWSTPPPPPHTAECIFVWRPLLLPPHTHNMVQYSYPQHGAILIPTVLCNICMKEATPPNSYPQHGAILIPTTWGNTHTHGIVQYLHEGGHSSSQLIPTTWCNTHTHNMGQYSYPRYCAISA